MTHRIQDKVILVTGATDGLGKHVALDFAAQGATLLLHGRNQRKGEAVLREIRNVTGSEKLAYYDADFSSLEAVRALSDRILAEQERLDVLINNAGIGAGFRGDQREMSRDGYELRFAVNYLAAFLLTHRLLPLLIRSRPARIVNVASIGQQPIDFADVMLADGFDGLRAYRQSKLALVMFTFDLAEQLRQSGVTVNCLHPATLMNTQMVLESDFFAAPMTTIAQGAQAVAYIASSAELDGVTGEYFNGRRRASAIPQAYERQARRQLWLLSDRLTGRNGIAADVPTKGASQ